MSQKDCNFNSVLLTSFHSLSLCLCFSLSPPCTVLEKQKTRSLGKAALGGPFSLMDHNGERKTNQDFLGQWLLLYFGFTFCPDICPDELNKMATVINKLGMKSHNTFDDLYPFPTDETPGLPKLQPLFISVDPDRDTPKVIKDYLQGKNNFFMPIPWPIL